MWIFWIVIQSKKSTLRNGTLSFFRYKNRWFSLDEPTVFYIFERPLGARFIQVVEVATLSITHSIQNPEGMTLL
jgi:hypothetical protein